MNRPVCHQDKIALGNLLFEEEERSSRTQGGVTRAPHRTNPVRPSTRLATGFLSTFAIFRFGLTISVNK